ncbi:hypothetical protein Tco_0519372 [Tanacetum coccineum]
MRRIISSHSTGGAIPSSRGFTDLTGSDFMVGGFRTVVNPDADLQKVYVPKWNVTNGSGVDTATNCKETVDELALHVEVKTRAEFNIRERRRLSAKCEEQESLLVQTNEVKLLREQSLALEKERDSLVVASHGLWLWRTRSDEQVKMMEKKLAKVDADLVAVVLHLEETFCPHLLTVVASRRWLLDHGMPPPHNKSRYYDAAMQQFHDVSFSLLSELKSRKDASIKEVMDILRLEGPLADPSPFLTGSHSTGGAIPSARGFTDLTGSDFMVGGFRTVVNPDADLQKVYVPKWNVTNGSGVDTATDCRETVDELAPQCFFPVVHNMEHDQLFNEFNVGTARQVCLSVEVRTRAEFNIRERRRLSTKCEEQESLLVQTNEENASLKKQLLLKEAEAVEAIRLRGQAYAFEATEKSLQEEVKLLRERSLALEKERDSLVVASTRSWLQDKECEDAQTQIPPLLLSSRMMCTSWNPLALISARRLLPEVAFGSRHEARCREVPKFPRVSFCSWDICWPAISKEKQSGLAVGIIHGREGRNLEDVAAYNPSTDADYDAAMQQFHDVSFSLFSELKSRKDASIEEVMDILRLEGSLAEFLGMGDLQPNVDQLMVPIYHPEDPVAVGSTSLSFSLNVLNQRVERIKGNLAGIRSALLGVFSPLRDPLSSIVLTGGEAVPENMPAVLEKTLVPKQKERERLRRRRKEGKEDHAFLLKKEDEGRLKEFARYIRIPLRIQALGASEITHGDGKRMDRWLQKRKEELKLQKERSRQKARKIHGLSKRDRACVVHSKISQTMKDSSKASATKNLKKEEQKILASRH